MDEVQKQTNKIMKELDQRKEILVKSVNDAENRSDKINRDLDFRKTNLSNAINSNNANKIFSIYSEEKTSRNPTIEHVETTFKKLPTFVPQKLEVKEFKFGSLVETNEDKKQFEFKVIKQYKTKLPIVENLVCGDDADILMSGFPNYELQMVKLSDESLNNLHIFKKHVYNMTSFPSGGLLLSLKESSLKILSNRSSKLEPTKYKVKPSVTLAVHVTGDHTILVGTRENQQNSFPVNGPRQVIMMNIDGKKEKVYHTDNKGRLIFTVPFRITTDNNKNIYVIDTLDEKLSGRIVALNTTNGVRWVYSGNSDTNKELTFKPKDLVATNSTNIVVTDMSNDIIHIINTSGQCIHYLNTIEQLGIHCPCSIDMDNTGTLYIGCCRYQSEPEEAKIYTVQVSGF
ncbi:uncharacterized protein LOC134701536 [Mytilus trossulus]|uniref:uncharacterized protein LOC134701536 n=1 Tax=Mytilus trossulus TaxID=6551 RepID=UPI003007A557